MKRCPRCGETKPISEFDKNRANSSGISSWCKTCKYEENRDRKKNNRTKYREIDKAHHYKWVDAHPHRNWATRSINRHKEQFVVEIDLDWLEKKAIETEVCPFCGVDLYYGRGKGYDRTNTPTLERLDNGNIITEQNAIIICYKCNATKSNRTIEEFIAYCKKVIPVLERIQSSGMPYGSSPREKSHRGRTITATEENGPENDATEGSEVD